MLEMINNIYKGITEKWQSWRCSYSELVTTEIPRVNKAVGLGLGFRRMRHLQYKLPATTDIKKLVN